MAQTVRMAPGEAALRIMQQEELEAAGINGPKEIEAYFSTGSFHELFDFAKQYSNLDGVAQIVESGKQRLVKYDEVRKQTVEKYQPQIDSAFSAHKEVAAKLDRFKKLRKLSLILFPVYLILGPSIRFLFYVAAFDFYAMIALVVVCIVFSHKEGSAYRTCRDVYNEAKGIATKATSREEAANDQAMKAIDDIYLSTLSIADREAIITRRLQQQQLEEQRAHNQQAEAAQRAHQQRVEEEQRAHNNRIEEALRNN